jgi:hypothetical protein
MRLYELRTARPDQWALIEPMASSRPLARIKGRRGKCRVTIATRRPLDIGHLDAIRLHLEELSKPPAERWGLPASGTDRTRS